MINLKNETLQTLYRYSLALSQNHDLSYDLVHDSLVKLKGKLVFNKEAYLKKSIRNNFYDLYRNKKKDTHPDPLPEAIDTEDLLIKKDLVNYYLTKLAPEERELLYLVYVEDYTYKEVAKVFKVKIGTIMSRLARVKEKVKTIRKEGL